jgi:hypothetical protein
MCDEGFRLLVVEQDGRLLALQEVGNDAHGLADCEVHGLGGSKESRQPVKPRELLGLPLHEGAQPRVLDGESGSLRQGAQQPQILLFERRPLRVQGCDDSDPLPTGLQRGAGQLARFE